MCLAGGKVTPLLLKLGLVDLAPGIALAQNVQRRLLAQLGFAASGSCAEAASQHHDGGNDQAPEQQHAYAHCTTSESKSVISPHHLYLPKPARSASSCKRA